MKISNLKFRRRCWQQEMEGMGIHHALLAVTNIFIGVANVRGSWKQLLLLLLLISNYNGQSIPTTESENLAAIRNLRNQGQYAESLAFSDSLINSYTHTSRNDYLAAIHHNKGRCFLDLGIYDLALESFTKCFSIYEENKQDLSIAITLNSIGNIHRLIGDSSKANLNYQKSLTILQSLDERSQLAIVHNNIGLLKIIERDFVDAMMLFNISLGYSSQLKDTLNMSRPLLNLGEVFRSLNQLDSAEYYYAQSLELKKAIDDKPGLAILNNNLAELYFARNQPVQARKYLEEGNEISLEHGFIEHLAKNYEIWSSYYESIGDWEHAFEAYQQYDYYQDSLLNKEKARAITEMQVRFETTQKEQALLEVQEENEIQKTLLEFQQIAIWALAGIAALLIIAGFLLYRIYLLNRRAKEEAQLRIREQHHRIENNISVLASVLSLAAQNSTSEEAKNIARDGENRLNAMNLLHKELYWDEASIVIRLDNYIRSLVHHLYGLFKGPDLKAINIETDEVEVNVSTAIPLSLILTELLMNAFKHGGHPDEPKWTVQLSQDQNHITLTISDNGPNMLDIHNSIHSSNRSFGLNLVNILTKQIKGSIDTFSTADETSFEVLIPIKSS